MHVVGPVDVVAACVPLVQIDTAEIDHPEERRHVLDHRKVDDVSRRVLDRARLDPRRPRRRRALHEEELPRGAVRVALHDHSAVAQVGEEHRRDRHVVADEVALREAEVGPEDLAEIGEPDLAVADGDGRVVDVGRDEPCGGGAEHDAGSCVRGPRARRRGAADAAPRRMMIARRRGAPARHQRRRCVSRRKMRRCRTASRCRPVCS